MKQRPIIFKTEMVTAILDGRKTQTRRIIKESFNGCLTNGGPHPCPNPPIMIYPGEVISSPFPNEPDIVVNCEKVEAIFHCSTLDSIALCRFGKPGDLLYVREKWMIEAWIDSELYIRYAATPDDLHIIPARYDNMEIRAFFQRYANKLSYSPTIHMPKAFARTWLKITNIKAERLQDISEQDAIAEGIQPVEAFCSGEGIPSRQFYKNYLPFGYTEVLPEDSFQSLWDTVNGPSAWELNPWVWVITFEKTQPPETT